MNVLRLGDHVRTKEAVPAKARNGWGGIERRFLEGTIVELGDEVRVDVEGFHYPPTFSYEQVHRV